MSTQTICFHYLIRQFTLTHRKKLKEFILLLCKKENNSVGVINYIFCSDNYLLQHNRRFLKHNTFTDIITFHSNAPEEPLSGDIFISIDRVRENAGLYEESFYRELHRVIFHGALHLCGYRDKTPAEKNVMRRKEADYLNHYFVSRETF